MARRDLHRVRKELGFNPIVEGAVGAELGLYVERYLYQAVDVSVSALPFTVLVVQLGGGQVTEGERDQMRSRNVPSQSLLLPRGVSTHWHYSGGVDFAAVHVLEGCTGIAARLDALARTRDAPMQFAEPLVGASAHLLVDELQKGRAADTGFMTRLASMMLEQSWRVLTTPDTRGINPRHAHFARLQRVLNHIHEHLGAELPIAVLARLAGVSAAHFRRIFEDATGVTPHRYILGVRLEKARNLLSMSPLPIAHIAQECGFGTQSHFTACFRAAHAVTPAAYRASLATH